MLCGFHLGGTLGFLGTKNSDLKSELSWVYLLEYDQEWPKIEEMAIYIWKGRTRVKSNFSFLVAICPETGRRAILTFPNLPKSRNSILQQHANAGRYFLYFPFELKVPLFAVSTGIWIQNPIEVFVFYLQLSICFTKNLFVQIKSYFNRKFPNVPNVMCYECSAVQCSAVVCQRQVWNANDREGGNYISCI